MNKILNKTIKIVAATLLTLTLIFQTSLVSAQPIGGHVPIVHQSKITNLGPNSNQLQQTIQEEDKKVCQAQQGGLGGILQKAGSLLNTLQEGFGKNMGNTLTSAFEKVPGIIEKQIQTRVPQLIEQGLQNQLPSFIQNQIFSRFGSNASSDQVRAALPDILFQGLETLTPNILRNAVPQAINEGLEKELPSELVQQMQAQIPTILEEGGFNDQLRGLMASSTQDLPPLIRNALDQGEFDAATRELINGTAIAAGEGLNQSGAVIDFSRDLSQTFSRFFSPYILQNFMPSLSSVTSGFNPAGGAQTLGDLINDIPGIGGDFLRGLEVDRMMGQIGNDIGNAFGTAFANNIRTFQVNSILNSPDFLQRVGPDMVADLNRIPGVRIDSIEHTVAKLPDGTTMLGADGQPLSVLEFKGFEVEGWSTAFAGDASQGVLANADVVGQNAAGTFNLESFGANLQTSFLSGLSSSLAGGLAGLVAGIPFAGPLLAPMVQNIVSQSLNQLFGLGNGITPAGWPVQDVGVQQSLAYGVNPTLGKIDSQTKQSNQNEGQIIKLEEQIKKLEEQIKDLSEQTCTHQRLIRRLGYGHDPNASKAAIRGLLELKVGFSTFFSTGALVTKQQTGVESSTGNQEGAPLFVQNLDEEKDTAQAEAASLFRHNIQNNPDLENGRELANKLKEMEQSNKAIPPGNLTKAESAQLSGDTSQMRNPDYWNLTLRGLDPANNKSAQLAIALGGQLAVQAEAIENTKLAYVAGQGFKNVEVGEGGETEDGAPLSRRILTPGSYIRELNQLIRSWPIWRALLTNRFQEDAALALLPHIQKETSDLTVPLQPGDVPQQDPCPGTEPCPNTGWQQQVNPQGFEQARNASRSSAGGGSLFGPGFGAELQRQLEQGLKGLVDQGFSLGEGSISNLVNRGAQEIPNRLAGTEPGYIIRYQLFNIFREILIQDDQISDQDKAGLINSLVELIYTFLSLRIP